jgi:hypothetical protein
LSIVSSIQVIDYFLFGIKKLFYHTFKNLHSAKHALREPLKYSAGWEMGKNPFF